MRVMKVAVAVTALVLSCGAAFAQSGWRWQDRDRDDRRWQQNDRHRKEYDKGFRDGQNDRRHNRRPHPRHDNEAYRRGYHAGYGQNQGGVWQEERRRTGDRDHDGDDRWGRDRGGFGQPQNVQQIAYNNGFQEGLRYGQADRGRHSYRPTHSDNYKHGKTGYMESLGDRNVYKQNFQRGFRDGYDRGYGPH